ncbi:MAG TPA: succinylglutamate desuccinylase/aspartoacylase family protein [Candidatus Limivivens merdigallinarum]|uniref:Succinylglutamate desuccinylase/aspartoacylase family protein n=1 Tax=Candidatus Limivivens merdigallinarum TaxID=2840859 RepID=A0A9D1D0E6_9FIRM|nr:succinylglutamate desuccinylase/aspartoacylase family protein [Candidatus Limivivens merdigallinarum]
MIETVVSMELPVDESLRIQKNRIMPLNPTGKEKRVAIVTGTHGDELEGQFVCYELQRRLKAEPGALKGIVDVYPALNPLGIDSITRGIPMFDLDMNRIFPGNADGPMMESLVSRLTEDLKGADLCVDIHASNIFLMELPQVRINEVTAETLVPLGKKINVDFVWIHGASTVLESTLAYSLNQAGTPTLVVEMGVGMRITKEYGYQLTEGILNVMKELGVWQGSVGEIRTPIVSEDRKVGYLNAEKAGIYVPRIQIGTYVKEGELLGEILNPLTGNVEQAVTAPIKGMVFTRREYPVVYSGSLLGRILGGIEE